MQTINFAYDNNVLDIQKTNHWHKNSYDNKFYPINGTFEECYYDYHAPIQTVFEKNGFVTRSITIKEAIDNNDNFVYVLTFRYLLNTVMKDANFFLTIPIEVRTAINDNKCVLVLNDSHESALYNDEFYSKLLSKFKDANIDFQKTILLTGNYHNAISDHPPNLVFWQYFETAMRLVSNNNIKIEDRFNTSTLKKFLCLNRVPRELRYYFMYEMYKRNLLKDFRASLDKVESINDIVSYNDNIMLNNIINKEQFNRMLAELPWVVDSNDFNINHWDTINYKFPIENLIFITTETLFQSSKVSMFLTEKTFKPISLKMPFIILGQPGTLEQLKRAGYKTFDTLWDESYDQELDVLSRMHMICDLVETLSKRSIDELTNMVKSINDILEHNYTLLMSRRPEIETINAIKNNYFI